MSRCFPYPPPGYVRNGTTGEALIESIKLEREREKTRKERKKEKKREKKEKKREKEEKVKKISPGSLDGTKKKLDSVCSRNEEWKGKNKSFKDEAEQLERSDITEEHGQSVSSENLCYTSDGTQSGINKRKRDASSSDVNRKPGNIIRILLPLQKHREPNVPSVSKDEPCSTSGRVVSQVCSTSGRTGVLAQDVGSTSGSKLTIKEIQTPELLYKALVGDWVPPPLEYDSLDSEDDDGWLFQSKRQDRKESQRKNEIEFSGCESSSFRPLARFLPEANVYALPYTIPF